ncbi:MAG: deoxyribodipyrimidine photo-lyase, partial [Deltaproteobacteria bacterium]|nr:deoxyribodipyrimidine photo-lyase [Deltaproteobacteria bacterium]
MKKTVNQKRIRLLKDGIQTEGPVAYWMSRDQRARDNWALLFAQEQALLQKKPLLVMFCLVPGFLNATMRQYAFMLKGLEEVAGSLRTQNIPFYLGTGTPEQVVPKVIQRHDISTLVTDFDPLKIKRRWKDRVAERIAVPFFEADAHNIVPCWTASPKQDFAARTFRPKIGASLYEFLEDFPPLKKHPYEGNGKIPAIPWQTIGKDLTVDRTVSEVNWLKPGEKAARSVLRDFITKKLHSYNDTRNDPTRDGQSNLSPYLHFGHIAAQRVALEVRKSLVTGASRESYLEELIVRRELSDNFCFYNDKYDTIKG